MISFEDFQKIELKIASVRAAERVEGSSKLVKLTVSLGVEERQIVAGIGRTHEPDALVGREIVVVANLEPKFLGGVESQGMLLAASDGSGAPILLVPEREAPSGSTIR
ncbi:MAG: methionine--tRNA ligase subunit beta [Candidatus Colwellbacteria bacterium]|nr:methionine--tRNA ligase subunit beta [Candidatus Colwellbacteria bacterium]